MELLLLSIVVVLAIAVAMVQQTFSAKRDLPGPGVLKIMLNLVNFIRQPYLALTQWSAEYGPIFSFQAVFRKVIVISDPSLIKQIFKEPSTSGRLTDHPIFNTLNKNGHGVGWSEGEMWKEQREFLIKNLRKFNSNEAHILTEVNDLIQYLDCHENKAIDCQSQVRYCVGNVLWRILFSKTGGNIGETSSEIQEITDRFLEAFQRVATSVLLLFPVLRHIAPHWSGWKEYVESIQSMNDLVDKEIAEHIKTYDKTHIRDLTDYFLREVKFTTNPASSFYQQLGELNMGASITDLLLAGTDTSSSVLSWALLFLSHYMNVQEKLHEEIDNVIGSECVSLKHRPKMPYTTAVIAEVMRRGSVAPLGVPHAVLEDKTINGYHFPQGALIITNIFAVHYSKGIWKDPNEFRPERFIENGRYVNRRELIPFGEGKRKCLGEANARDLMFLFVTTIFQRFVVKPENAGVVPNFNPKLGIGLAPQPYKVKFITRNV